jgi:hypothetical protein
VRYRYIEEIKRREEKKAALKRAKRRKRWAVMSEGKRRR